ncbi:MAG: DUF1571 domain-containing protein [Myxococcales bacterium]|nr:MAG: DUF1571 domain-containing protein [Myxococcales bacterium]
MKYAASVLLPVLSIVLLLAGLLYAQDAPPPAQPPAGDAAAQPAPPADDPMAKAQRLVGEMQAAVGRVSDFTANFYKKEYKKGQLPQEIAFMKWRNKPRTVYMKWIGVEKKNQEIIWGEGKNDGKIHAHKGSFPDLTVNLGTNDWMAMKDNRHPITDSGFPHTVGLIAKDMKLAQQHPDWKVSVKDLGTMKVYGAASACYEAETDKAAHPEFYGYKALICMHNALKLPTKVQIWDKEDGKVRLVEDYGYENIKVNVGLSEKDFDPENKEYNF